LIRGLEYTRQSANPKSPRNQQRVCVQEAALSDVDQPALGRQRHGPRAADGVELFQNGLHVILAPRNEPRQRENRRRTKLPRASSSLSHVIFTRATYPKRDVGRDDETNATVFEICMGFGAGGGGARPTGKSAGFSTPIPRVARPRTADFQCEARHSAREACPPFR
jgi:hypothetical protein